MLFLIEYDRQRGKLVALTEFGDEDWSVAEAARLDLELRLNRNGAIREVVLLDAANQEALRLTHRRYFEGLAELGEAPSTKTGS